MVDKLVEYPHVRLPFKHWCHMASDVDFEELHPFAAQLGIPRHRFQGDHYDLPPHLRELAVEFGAGGGSRRDFTARGGGGPGGARVRAQRVVSSRPPACGPRTSTAAGRGRVRPGATISSISVRV